MIRGEVSEEETALLMKQAGAYKDQIKDARKWIRRNQENQYPTLVRRIFIHSNVKVGLLVLKGLANGWSPSLIIFKRAWCFTETVC